MASLEELQAEPCAAPLTSLTTRRPRQRPFTLSPTDGNIPTHSSCLLWAGERMSLTASCLSPGGMGHSHQTRPWGDCPVADPALPSFLAEQAEEECSLEQATLCSRVTYQASTEALSSPAPLPARSGVPAPTCSAKMELSPRLPHPTAPRCSRHANVGTGPAQAHTRLFLCLARAPQPRTQPGAGRQV